MKVALVIDRYDPHGGGAEGWTHRHAQMLLADGHEVHLFAPTIVAAPHGAVCHEVNQRTMSLGGKRLAVPDRLAEALAAEPFDVIHDQGVGWYADIFMPHHGTRRAVYRQKSKLLARPERWLRPLAYHLLPRYLRFAALERRQFRDAPGRPGKRFIAVSDMVAQQMKQFYGVSDERIHVVYNGADVERFQPSDGGWQSDEASSDPPPLREGLGEGEKPSRSHHESETAKDAQYESERTTNARTATPSPGRVAPDVASRPPSPSEAEGSHSDPPPLQPTIENRKSQIDNPTTFLIVAHDWELKGVNTLLRATRQLLSEGHAIRTVIVGSGRMKGRKVWGVPLGKPCRYYPKLVKRWGCEHAVEFAGAADDPRPFYAAADVYVQPSLYDACSLVVLEALACGLPVITSRHNGVSALMADDREGFIVDDPQNPAELAAQMRKLLDADVRRRMSAAARRLAERQTLRHQYEQVLDVYRRVVEARQSGAFNP